MKNMKRFLALAGVVLLLAMYGSTMVFAVNNSPKAPGLFMASLFCTIAVPVLLYAFTLVFNYLKKFREVDAMKDQITQKVQDIPQIDTIVFDVGRVLVDYDWKPLLVDELKFDEKTIHEVEKAMFLSPDWDEMDRGEKTDEELLEKFISNNPAYEKEIRQVFDNRPKTIQMRSYILPWVKKLKEQGYCLYILSNFATTTLNRVKDQFDFLTLMDGAVWSCEWKQIKPQKDIYLTLFKEYDIIPDHAVFIDDKEENLKTAKELGMQTILYTEFEAVCAQLNLMCTGKM